MTERAKPYVTIRTFADPTPREAFANIAPELQTAAGVQRAMDLAGALTIIQERLTELRKSRKAREITRGEFAKQHDPLRVIYNILLQEQISKKGGVKWL